jgi:hypothetical protein
MNRPELIKKIIDTLQNHDLCFDHKREDFGCGYDEYYVFNEDKAAIELDKILPRDEEETFTTAAIKEGLSNETAQLERIIYRLKRDFETKHDVRVGFKADGSIVVVFKEK